MKKIFENKIFVIVSLFLIFGAVTVIASTIGDSGFSGIQVDNYFTGSGKAGIGQNISFNDSEGNSHSLEFEDGLLVNYSLGGPYQTPLPASENLVAYWKLDESSGSAKESVNGIYNGTITGVTQGVFPSKIGTSYLFNGNNQYIEVDSAPNLSTNWTVSAWVNSTTLKNYAGIFSKVEDDRTGGENFMLVVHDNGEIGSGDGAWAFSSGANINEGNWYHLAWVFDKDNTRILYYVNGTNVGSDENFDPVDNSTGYSFFMGSWATDTQYDYAGHIDEVGIWNVALTSTEIEELYNNGNGLTY